MKAYLEAAEGFVPWAGQRIDDVLYPLGIVTSWSEQELAAVGLYIPVVDAVPEGKIVTSRAVERVNGVVKYVDTLKAVPPPTDEDVDAERARRVAAGFIFNGVLFQSRELDRENIMGAGTAALGAIVAGVLPGDLRWHGGDSDFMWIAADNTTHLMDAQTVYAFGLAAMAHKTAHIFAARAIKDTDPTPADYDTNESYWP